MKCWETETYILWNLCNANLCWESSSCASSGTASKFLSVAEFNSFDLEKSSFPGEMNLPAELSWTASTLPHKKTCRWFSPKFHWLWELQMLSCLWLKRAISEMFLSCVCTQIPGQAHSKTGTSWSWWIFFSGCLHWVLRFLPFSFC